MRKSSDTIIAGCAGGMAQVLAGQPFDMIKVRLQAATPSGTTFANLNVADCVRNIIKSEGGLRALWKGSMSPLLSVGAAVAIQFGINEKSRGLVKKITGRSSLDLSHYFGCGMVAGLANSIVSIPTEHSRIRMQVQSSKAKTQFNSSIDCVKKIMQCYGLKGLYKGGVPTVLREGMAFGIYFSFYEWLISKMLRAGQTRSDLPVTKVAVAGSLTGIVVWLATFPIDVVKTKIQVDSFTKPMYQGSIDCASKVYNVEGLRGFYKGFSPCLLRAVPANAATFLAYETTMQLISQMREKTTNNLF